MTKPSADNPLLILAMDHRDSFARQFGVEEARATSEQREQMSSAKRLIYSGLHAASAQLGAGQAGVLVDEELGSAVLRQAHSDGLALAMPVEKSGQRLFSLEYGAETAAHIAEFDPSYVKVLVRMNPDDDPRDTPDQLHALAELSELLHSLDRAFLYELLVPPTDGQLSQAGGQEGYDRDLRPDLVVRVITANQQAGVEPTLWKIEGLETASAARQVVEAAKTGGRAADCIILGRDAPQATLDHWLQVAAPVEGFVGFAVGRSIWEEPLNDYRRDNDADRLSNAVTGNYLHFARIYLEAR
ncbi:2-deoxy-5-keto-D-gluconate 6-phosphate aldolase domain-containing protein [Jatrophihabitans sp. DSM 45814]